MKKVLKQCVKLCIDLKLIEGNTLFIDRSKIKANAFDKPNMDRGEMPLRYWRRQTNK